MRSLIEARKKSGGTRQGAPPLRAYVSAGLPHTRLELLLFDFETGLLPGFFTEDHFQLLVPFGLVHFAFAHIAAELDLGAAHGQFLGGVEVLTRDRALRLLRLSCL